MQKIPLILTRPDGSNADIAARLSPDTARLLDVITSPLIAIEALAPPATMPRDAVAIFTSSNGVRFAPAATGRRAFCVGAATTDRAQAAGWQAVCTGQNVTEMIAFFAKTPPGDAVFHLCGRHVRGDVAGKLRAMGVRAEQMPLYDQKLLPLTPQALTALSREKPVIVPLFSPRAAAHFAAIAPPNGHLILVTLSAAVTECTRKMQARETHTASVPTAEALVACIEKAVQSVSLG